MILLYHAYDGVDMKLKSINPVVMPQSAAICDDTAADGISASPHEPHPDAGRCKLLQSEFHQILCFLHGDKCHVIRLTC